MSRELTVVQPLPPGQHRAAFCRDPATWFPDARPLELNVWTVHVGVSGLERPVACRVGTPWRVGGTLRRRIRWTALSSEGDAVPIERFLPELDAELLLLDDAAAPSLVLQGEVEVPLGRVGEAVDALALGRVARRSVAGFLATIAEGLVAQARANAALDTESQATS
jgi:hypothetical protein